MFPKRAHPAFLTTKFLLSFNPLTSVFPLGIMKKIREKYVTNPYFDPNLVKKVSTACEGLCKWVRAIEVYDRVIKIVAPKKAKLSEAETELANQMDKLNEKRAQLQQVTDKLQALNDEFAAMTKKKKDLEDNIELCSQKLDRAEKLIQAKITMHVFIFRSLIS